jgi:hypothetical protein
MSPWSHAEQRPHDEESTMSIPPISSPNPSEQRSPRQTGSIDDTPWTGLIAFAGIVMVLLGIFHAIQGLVALFNSDYYVSSDRLVIHVNYTAWGWFQLLAGILVIAAGAGLFAGQIWARAVAILLAMISAVINVGFLSAAPLWSAMMIGLDILIIWALTVHGSEMKA